MINDPPADAARGPKGVCHDVWMRQELQFLIERGDVRLTARKAVQALSNGCVDRPFLRVGYPLLQPGGAGVCSRSLVEASIPMCAAAPSARNWGTLRQPCL